MDFLDRFTPRDRDRLIACATTVRLARGELLLRRGERGSDMFRVAEGELEVVDTRSQPVIVIDVVGRGSVVGEMSFVEDSLRNADVRTPEGAICQRWERVALLRLFEEDPTLAVGFYRVISQMLVERHRAVTSSAVAGAFGGNAIPRGPTNDVASADARALGGALRQQLMDLEPVLRRDRPAAERELNAALRNFGAALGEALARMSEEDGRAAGQVVLRDLHPYTMRSHLGELSLDRDSGSEGTRVVMAHALKNHAEGDGPLGEVLDGWLLGLPTCRAFRERSALALQTVLDALPGEPPLRLCVVNASGGMVPGLVRSLSGRIAGEILCVDGDRLALQSVEAAVGPRPRDLRLRLVQEDLAALLVGRSSMRFAPQQIVVLDGLLEYLPERVAASALGWARGVVAPGGTLVLTALVPSADDALFRHLLGWPLVRRTRATIRRLLGGAGFEDVRTYEVEGAGLVAAAR